MTRTVVVNKHEWEVFDGDVPVELPKRGRPRSNEAARRTGVIEKASAEVDNEDFMAVAAKYQDEFYGERTVADKDSIEYYHQRKHVAKLIRKQWEK